MLVERLLPAARERLVTIGTAAPLIDAARLLRAGTDIVVVCDPGSAIAGVVTKTDVVSQISRCQGAGCIAPASAAMTTDVVSCGSGDWLKDVWETMKPRRLKNIPVVDSKNRPVGVLIARDILEFLLRDAESEETLLRDYVMGVGYR